MDTDGQPPPAQSPDFLTRPPGIPRAGPRADGPFPLFFPYPVFGFLAWGAVMSESTSSVADPVPRPWVGVVGDGTPGPGRVKGKPGRPPKKKRVEGEGEGMLRVMRYVLINESRHDRDPREKAMRAWMDKDPKGFLQRLEEEERVERNERRVVEDSGHDRVERLIEKLLKVGVGEVD